MKKALKVLAAILAIVLICSLALVGCDGSGTNNNVNNNTNNNGTNNNDDNTTNDNDKKDVTVTKEEWKTAIDAFFDEADNFSAQFENKAGGLSFEKNDIQFTDSVVYGTRTIDGVEKLLCMIKFKEGEKDRVGNYIYNTNMKQWFQTYYDLSHSSGEEIDDTVVLYKQEYLQDPLLFYIVTFNDDDAEPTMDVAYDFYDKCELNATTGKYEAETTIEEVSAIKFAFGFEDKVLTSLDLTLDRTLEDVTETMVNVHVYDVGTTKQDESLLPAMKSADCEESGLTEQQWQEAIEDFFQNGVNFSTAMYYFPTEGDGGDGEKVIYLITQDVLFGYQDLNGQKVDPVYILRRENSFEQFFFDEDTNEWKSSGATDSGEIPGDVTTYFDNIVNNTREQTNYMITESFDCPLESAFSLFSYDIKEKTFVLYSSMTDGFIQVKFTDGKLSSVAVQMGEMLVEIYDIGTTTIDVPFEA